MKTVSDGIEGAAQSYRRGSGLLTHPTTDQAIQPWVAFFTEALRLAELARVREANASASVTVDNGGGASN